MNLVPGASADLTMSIQREQMPCKFVNRLNIAAVRRQISGIDGAVFAVDPAAKPLDACPKDIVALGIPFHRSEIIRNVCRFWSQ
jgi:hypothetical protein